MAFEGIRRHSTSGMLTQADILRVQNQVLEAKVLELTEELTKTQYELRLERVNYRHLHKKSLSLQNQLEAQGNLILDLEQRLATANAQLHAQPEPTTLQPLCDEHLNMLHEDIAMYQARCSLYEDAIRELWRTYVMPKTDDEPPIVEKKLQDDDDSDDTMSMDSDCEGQEEEEVPSWMLMEHLCAAISESVEMHQEYLAAISDMEEQLAYDSQQHWNMAKTTTDDDEEPSSSSLEADDSAFTEIISDLHRLLSVAACS
ncbi:hypothetical protein LEN26_012446 [Aphanomyces euteiches]|nr:hypothetical protein LEN26_012446 [Aphanomyces euteiches]